LAYVGHGCSSVHSLACLERLAGRRALIETPPPIPRPLKTLNDGPRATVYRYLIRYLCS
jgi:hypothetical protein